jgi:hypothetical protein
MDPTKQGRVLHVESALTYHLFDIAVREADTCNTN